MNGPNRENERDRGGSDDRFPPDINLPGSDPGRVIGVFRLGYLCSFADRETAQRIADSAAARLRAGYEEFVERARAISRLFENQGSSEKTESWKREMRGELMRANQIALCAGKPFEGTVRVFDGRFIPHVNCPDWMGLYESAIGCMTPLDVLVDAAGVPTGLYNENLGLDCGPDEVDLASWEIIRHCESSCGEEWAAKLEPPQPAPAKPPQPANCLDTSFGGGEG